MAYFKPYIDESGYHYPTYNEILEQLVDDMQTIYGSGIYLGSDSQDYELLSVLAEKIYDTYQTGEIAYHSHSPASSAGAGLDYIVAVNGIARKQATKSTARVILTGAPRTAISGGVIADASGHLWDLPPTVVLDDGGRAEATATCRETGLIQIGIGELSRIMTPTMGWTSVSNPSGAISGTSTETDSELRARQALSVAQPSRSILNGLRGAIAAIADVNRSEVYENDTNDPDENGIPGHSVCAVVEGGSNSEIAQTIFLRKGPGCGTYGDVEIAVPDESGRETPIRFKRPRYVDVDITVNITRRSGYTADIPEKIVTAVAGYMEKFAIGTDLTTSIIWMVAQQINVNYLSPAFSITSVTAARRGEPQGAGDIIIAYDEVARTNAANVTVNLQG